MAALLSHAKSVLRELRNCTRWPSPFRFVSFLLCHIAKLMTIISKETVLPFPRPHNPNNEPNFQLFRYDLHCKLNSAKCLTWLKTSAFLPLGINLVSGTPTPYYHVIQHTETISHCVFFQLKLYLYPSQAFEVHDWYISSKTGWKTSCNPQQRQRFDWNLPQTFFLLGLPCLPSAILAAVLSLTYKEGKQEKIFCFTYKWHWNKFVEIISDMTGLVTSNKIK